MDLLNWFGVLTAFVYLLLFSPITIWLLIYFYQLRSVEIMKYRRKSLVYYMNIITVLGLIFQWAPISITIWNINMGHTWTHIIYLTDGCFIWLVFALFCIKTWLLFYDKQYYASVAAETWKTQINSSYKSWYIINKHKWGNFNYVMKVIIIPLICCIILEGILEFTFLLQFNVHSMLVLSVIFIIPSFIIHCLLKGFDDIFGIKQEIFYQIMVMFIIMIIHFIELLIQIKYHFGRRTDWLIAINISSITLFLMSFISTAYPIYLHRKQCQIRELQKYQITQQISGSFSPSTSTSSNAKPQHNSLGHMLTVVADKNGFNAFMNHLINEFATESLLFVVELIQIKYEYQFNNKYCVHPEVEIQSKSGSPFGFLKLEAFTTSERSIRSARSDDLVENVHVESYILKQNSSVWGKISVPSGLPRSEVLTVNKKLKDQLYALYCKYIKEDSLHTLNIPYGLRTNIDEYFACNYKEIVNEIQHKHNKLNVTKAYHHTSASNQHNKALELLGLRYPSKEPPNNRVKETKAASPHSASRSRSRSKGKVTSKVTLTTPILEGNHDEFPNIPSIEDVRPKSKDIELNHDINETPDDLMVILDYNTDEEQEEKEEDIEEDETKEIEDKLEIKDDDTDYDDDDMSDEEDEKDDDKDISELLNVLDGVCIEMMNLLFSPYLRFIKTENGQKIVKTLIIDHQS